MGYPESSRMFGVWTRRRRPIGSPPPVRSFRRRSSRYLVREVRLPRFDEMGGCRSTWLLDL